MSSFKQKVEERFGAKVIIGIGGQVLDTYEEISTADCYDIYAYMPGGKWSNVFPESDLYYYADNITDAIRNHIKSGGQFYVSETVAEQLNMEDPDGEFWEDMCYEHDLIEDEFED
jgi:hypothetical protein